MFVVYFIIIEIKTTITISRGSCTVTYAKLKLYTPFSSDCVDHLNNYTCRCKDGFTGGNCEFEINECQSSPCVNGKFVYDVIVVVLAGVGVVVKN